jgi:hypothetical protein
MSKATKTFAIATVIAAFASVAFAQDDSARPSQDAPSVHHRGPWPIQNGFDHQPTQQDLPPAVQREEGHVSPSERDFDKNLEICRPC